MGNVKGKWKKNTILKVLERWRSLGGGTNGNSRLNRRATYSKSLSENGKHQIAPSGCFSVFVGPQKERFVVKTEFVNHPLFKMLLDEAEMEYGFQSDGPIWLPCNVDLFYKVLAQMKMDKEQDHNSNNISRGPKGFSLFFVLRSPTRLFCHMNRGHGAGAYSVMDSEILRIK